MNIAVINASSQRDKNTLLHHATQMAAEKQGGVVANLGVFPREDTAYSYIQLAVCGCILLASKAADFVVTGCSSGTGMMLACNSLPGVLCGYLATPADAYLFGRINAGNAASIPLSLNFGWAGEINLRYTLEKLFEEPFGTGYPPEDAERKREDTRLLKAHKALSHRPLTDILSEMDHSLLAPALSRQAFRSYLNENGQDRELVAFVNALCQCRRF